MVVGRFWALELQPNDALGHPGRNAFGLRFPDHPVWLFCQHFGLSQAVNLIERVHSRYVQERRVRVLSNLLAQEIPANARVLDVGAGDGWMAHSIQEKRPDLQLEGLDILMRKKAYIPIIPFNGKQIPQPDGSYDVVMFVDVLHHTEDPMVLLKEAARVMRRTIVLKDHTANGVWAHSVLRFMDGVGNRRYAVALPYNYWAEDRWRSAFDKLGLMITTWHSKLGLYPWPANLLFERGLHFVTRLERMIPGASQTAA